MRMWIGGVWRVFPAAALGLCLGLADPAGAQLYTWTLDDGSTAYTDDEKAIPARYRDRVEVRQVESLSGYKRFTPKDPGASRDYEERLARRLDYLRSLNANPPPVGVTVAPPSRSAEADRISLRSGRDGGSAIEISSDPSGEPVVVETVMMRRDGSAVAQPVRVTRRGDQILAIEQPRKRQWNVLTDVYDEADLREAME